MSVSPVRSERCLVERLDFGKIVEPLEYSNFGHGI